jgi:hypothetical protein
VDVAGEAPPAMREVSGYGDVLEPPAGSVRERVRLRPAVREALDIEAGRLGMTREALCRIVLEEIARKAANGPLAADGDAPAEVSVAAGVRLDAEDAPEIPAGYVGGAGDGMDGPLSVGAGPADAREDAGGEVVPEPRPAPARPGGRDLSRVRGRSAPEGAVVRVVRGVRRLSRLGSRRRSDRPGGAWGAVAAVALLVALAIGALAVSWRYEVVGAGTDGVYVVDRWRGVVWTCGASGGRSPACTRAVLGQSMVGGELAHVGRVR